MRGRRQRHGLAESRSIDAVTYAAGRCSPGVDGIAVIEDGADGIHFTSCAGAVSPVLTIAEI